MNYIKQLQAENESLKAQILESQNLTNELLILLNNDKFFWPNNYINTRDLFKPLQDIRMNLNINN
jgi:hypothetical protein